MISKIFAARPDGNIREGDFVVAADISSRIVFAEIVRCENEKVIAILDGALFKIPCEEAVVIKRRQLQCLVGEKVAGQYFPKIRVVGCERQPIPNVFCDDSKIPSRIYKDKKLPRRILELFEKSGKPIVIDEGVVYRQNDSLYSREGMNVTDKIKRVIYSRDVQQYLSDLERLVGKEVMVDELSPKCPPWNKNKEDNYPLPTLSGCSIEISEDFKNANNRYFQIRLHGNFTGLRQNESTGVIGEIGFTHLAQLKYEEVSHFFLTSSSSSEATIE